MARRAEIAAAAAALAALDVAAALAELRAEGDWVRPEIDDGTAFEISGGRHPTRRGGAARGEGQPFVANDCVLGERPASGSSPAPTWPARARFCGRTR